MKKTTTRALRELYPAAAITLVCGIEPTLRIDSGLILFNFPNTPEINNCISAYYSNSLDVDANAYAAQIRALRGQMFRIKEHGGAR